NPSGVRGDVNGLGGGSDDSWDPVWEVKTAIDSLGWTAEMRIPFSQLRYPSTTSEQTWGLQIWRQENRLNELSQWSFWGLTETGGPPRFGDLHGLVIHRAPGRARILPSSVGGCACAGLFGLCRVSLVFCPSVSRLWVLSPRRFGRSPRIAATRDTSAAYAGVPEPTSSPRAAKVTARTPSGSSIRLLDAVTRREQA